MNREQFEQRAASGPYCFLYRHALQYEQVDFSLEIWRTGRWHVRLTDNRAEQIQAWLTESLATALEHDDRRLATRAAFQAKGYLERLMAMGASVGGPRFHDAVRDAIERVVSWVAPV